MKFWRSLPLIWARMMAPFSSLTLNIVLGSFSVTIPSSSFATATTVIVSLNLGAVIAPVTQGVFSIANELSSTSRGEGGFGSTGKN